MSYIYIDMCVYDAQTYSIYYYLQIILESYFSFLSFSFCFCIQPCNISYKSKNKQVYVTIDLLKTRIRLLRLLLL